MAQSGVAIDYWKMIFMVRITDADRARFLDVMRCLC